MLTRQEIFTKALTGLRAQGKPAATTPEQRAHDLNLPMCCYRTPDGLKCAVGQLIPDAKYQPNMEGCITPRILVVCDIPSEEFQFTTSLQLRLHDHLTVGDFLAQLEPAAVEFAYDYGLEMPSA